MGRRATWLAWIACLAPGASLHGQAGPPEAFLEATLWGQVSVEAVQDGVAVPSALAFLPGGQMLIAERPAGRLSLVEGPSGSGSRVALEGVPPVYGEGGGGLLDVLPHPDFDRNGWLYLSYAAATDRGATLVVDRARIGPGGLVDRERLFEAVPPLETNDHFGGRMVLDGGYLFVTSGDRLLPDSAQSMSNHAGKVVRLHEDGSMPSDNPFVGRAGALPEIWSLGHRNPQGLALHPTTGELWSHEHGPQGGDEINRIVAGRNYGWPEVTFGEEYGGGVIGTGRTDGPGFEDPIYTFVPSIAPSGMLFHSGRSIPAWRHHLLVGALALTHLNHLTVTGDRVLHEERILGDRDWRVRSIAEGPDGAVYLGVDAGYVLRIATPDDGEAAPRS